MRHALGKLGERLETTVLEINEQGKEIDRLRAQVAHATAVPDND